MNVYLDQESAAMMAMGNVGGDVVAAIDELESDAAMSRVEAVNALLRLGHTVPNYLQAGTAMTEDED